MQSVTYKLHATEWQATMPAFSPAKIRIAPCSQKMQMQYGSIFQLNYIFKCTNEATAKTANKKIHATDRHDKTNIWLRWLNKNREKFKCQKKTRHTNLKALWKETVVTNPFSTISILHANKKKQKARTSHLKSKTQDKCETVYDDSTNTLKLTRVAYVIALNRTVFAEWTITKPHNSVLHCALVLQGLWFIHLKTGLYFMWHGFTSQSITVSHLYLFFVFKQRKCMEQRWQMQKADRQQVTHLSKRPHSNWCTSLDASARCMWKSREVVPMFLLTGSSAVCPLSTHLHR